MMIAREPGYAGSFRLRLSLRHEESARRLRRERRQTGRRGNRKADFRMIGRPDDRMVGFWMPDARGRRPEMRMNAREGDGGSRKPEDGGRRFIP